MEAAGICRVYLRLTRTHFFEGVTMELIAIVAIVGVIFAVSRAQAAPVKQKPAALEDFKFPQSQEGAPQSVTFGDCWTEDWMVLGVGNYRTTKIRTKSGK